MRRPECFQGKRAEDLPTARITPCWGHTAYSGKGARGGGDWRPSVGRSARSGDGFDETCEAETGAERGADESV